MVDYYVQGDKAYINLGVNFWNRRIMRFKPLTKEIYKVIYKHYYYNIPRANGKNNLIRLQQINAPADVREMLSTGICTECWDKYFDEEE